LLLERLVVPISLDTGLFLEGIKAIGGFLKTSITDAMETQDVVTQLNAVLKSTEGIAGVTAEQVMELGNVFERTTKFSAEATIGGQNLLLTFTNIGKDVFPLATETMLDMSQALKQDLKSSATQLGKALNNPIEGVSALSRVGVQFTKEQKELIKTLQESGRIEEAQAIILKELQTEFGGSAVAAGTTFSGKLEILKNKLGGVTQQIGDGILPKLTELADKFIGMIDVEKLTVMTEGVTEGLSSILDWVMRLIEAPSLDTLAEPLKRLFNFTDWFKNAVQDVDWNGLSNRLADGINSIDWAMVGQYVYQGISNVLQGLWTVVSEIDWVALTDALGNALKGLIAGLSGYPDWDSFVEVFEQAWFIIKFQWNAQMDEIKQAFSGFVTSIINRAIDLRNRLTNVLNNLPGFNFSEIPLIGSDVPRAGRASGGNVIAGQAYNVAEFNRPEVFVPQQNGRVENVKPAQMIDEGKLARAIAKELSKSMMPLIQLARA
jgi:hypothetical protein